ncbi:MAG: DoxX family protein [Bacteroidaceae bacterium]|nr:DoxX family protein [Bacteroidaceae bacterium]
MKKRIALYLIVNIARLVLGATYVFSGLTKAVDPAGMEHKLMAYFRQWDILTWTADSLWLTAIVLLLATVEFMLGIWLLIGIRRRFTSFALAAITAVFTLLTIYIYIKEPVPDCGCFGDAIKLTNGQTLLKNIVLLTLTLPILLYSHAIYRLVRRSTQWLASLVSAVFIVACGIYSSSYVPLVDFTNYVPGFSFNSAMEGKLGEQALEDAFNFAVLDTAGNDITPDVTLSEGYTFLAIAQPLSSTDRSVSDRIAEIYRRAKQQGDCQFYFLTASDSAAFATWRDATDAPYVPHHTDEGVLHSAAKTNPGLLLLHNDTIVAKWGRHNLPNIVDAQNQPVALQKLEQKPQKPTRRLTKLLVALTIPLIFIIFADAIMAGTLTLRRKSLRRMAKQRTQQPANQ